MLCSDAEGLTDISHQQVSKWRRRLKEPEKYRDMLFGAAYAKAMSSPNRVDLHQGQRHPHTPAGGPQRLDLSFKRPKVATGRGTHPMAPLASA